MAVGKNMTLVPSQGTVNGVTKIAENLGNEPAYVVITNPHATNALYVGGPDATAAQHGFSVAANGGTAAFYLAGKDKVYATTPGRALPTTTSVASTDIFSSTAHGMAIGDPVVFTALTGGAGLQLNTVYYVISSNFASGTFMLSETAGGATFNHTSNITACTVYTGSVARVFASGAQ